MVSIKNSKEVNGNTSTTPTVYIRGSLENNHGTLIDSGEIQITGNVTFTNNAILRDSGEFVDSDENISNYSAVSFDDL